MMNSTLIILIGISITFISNFLGSFIVFFLKKELSPKLNSIINGFSAGIMLSACVWGLILPSIEDSSHLGNFEFVPATIGIIVGCLFMLFIGYLISAINKKGKNPMRENHLKTTKFVVAFAIHNIPEGLAIGFTLGNALAIGTNNALMFALALCIGIAIQNLPEGAVVSLPVYKDTKNKTKAFFSGVLSGALEPISAIVGLLLASELQLIMPWLLAFSAGAIMFVSINDLIPEAKQEHNSTLGTWSFVLGFLIMMVLDLYLA